MTKVQITGSIDALDIEFFLEQLSEVISGEMEEDHCSFLYFLEKVNLSFCKEKKLFKNRNFKGKLDKNGTEYSIEDIEFVPTDLPDIGDATIFKVEGIEMQANYEQTFYDYENRSFLNAVEVNFYGESESGSFSPRALVGFKNAKKAMMEAILFSLKFAFEKSSANIFIIDGATEKHSRIYKKLIQRSGVEYIILNDSIVISKEEVAKLLN